MHTHDPQNFVCFFKQVLSKEGASNFVQEDSSLRVMKISDVWTYFLTVLIRLFSLSKLAFVSSIQSNHKKHYQHGSLTLKQMLKCIKHFM